MGFRKFNVSEVQDDYWCLYKKARRLVLPFCGFDSFNKKLFAADFLVLRNRFDVKVYGWYRSGQPKILVTHYKAKNPTELHASSIGAILIDPSTAPSEIVSFQECLRAELGDLRTQTVAPLNGHRHLGFALPSRDLKSEEIGFQSTSQSLLLQSFFAEGTAFRVSKKIQAGVEYIDSISRKKIIETARELPRYLSVRPVSQLKLRKEVHLYNQLLKRCKKDEEDFYALDGEEEWEIIRHSWPLLVSEYFVFLMYNGVEVGFCLALPDYNLVLENGSDAKNTLIAVANKRSISRARIFSSGILPHFKDRGWLELLKNQVALNMVENGVHEIEASFISESVPKTHRKQEFFLYGL